jgi:hypothetical protein
MQDGRFGQSHTYHLQHGDLTLTHLDGGGRIMSWMYLLGFGHGETISVQAAHPGLWIWVEAVSARGPTAFADGFGTQIARFRWQAGATIRPLSPGVELYNPNPGTFHNAPSLRLADGLVAARYMTADAHEHTAVYELGGFLAHRYVPVRVLDRPSYPGTGQGWALMPGGETIARLTGDHYSPANPPPGDTQLTIYDAGGIVSQEPILDGLDLSWREPEGVQPAAGQICYGFASGPATGRRASIYSRPQ